MQSDLPFPQDWPEHLGFEQEVSPVTIARPTDAHLLHLSAMNDVTFEQFCWWLLQKENSLVGCKRIGGRGAKQDGIDLFGYETLRPERLVVYECKCWDEFTPSKMGEAVDRFLAGEWRTIAKKFVLVVAQEDLRGRLSLRWTTEKKKLEDAGIEADVWDGHDLTLKVQSHPDILSKFFPGHTAQHFANEWMQRVSFIEQLSKAIFDSRPAIARLARQQLTAVDGVEAGEHGLCIDGELRNVVKSKDGWSFNGPWFSMSVMLPGGRFGSASGAITFKREDMRGVTITFDHRWLLERMLFAQGAPVIGPYRGFVVDRIEPDVDMDYVVDFPNCRMMISYAEVRELAMVVDSLTDIVRESLLRRERAWDATDFPFVKRGGGASVAIAALPVRVWREIIQFTYAHDSREGDSPWHMFDPSPNILKPFLTRATDDLDSGYHGIFYVTEELDGLCYDDEVVVLWQPNDMGLQREITPRGWWSCAYACQWLIDELLPEARRWTYQRHFGRAVRRLLSPRRAQMFAYQLDEMFVARDLRQRPLLRDGTWHQDIVETCERIQAFFSVRKDPVPFVRQQDAESLYRVAAMLARGGRGWPGYASSNLSLENPATNHAELGQAIEEHIRFGCVVASASNVDYVVRAILELLSDRDDWISTPDGDVIREALAPFARIVDQAAFIERHTRWR